jgi:hypothetical protein
MAFFGVILLLPGACAIYFMAGSDFSSGESRQWRALFALIWIVCLLISLGGVLLLLRAFRRN